MNGAMESHKQHRGKYPDEIRERALRIVLDHEGDHASQCEAICSVAELRRANDILKAAAHFFGAGVRCANR